MSDRLNGMMKAVTGMGWLRFKNLVSPGLGHRLVIPRKDDRYIIAYARSGRIWTRTMVTNVMNPEAQSDPDVFERQIPGVSIRKAIPLNFIPSPRIMSSHSLYVPGIAPTVYLVRDGRDCLISGYHFRRDLRGDFGPGSTLEFEAYFDLYMSGGIGWRWDEHVRSWLVDGKQAMGDDLLVIRFEDLKADTPSMLRKILAHLNIEADQERISQAIEMASTERAREIERKKALERGEAPPEGNKSFYRGGRTGQWQDYLTPEMQETFMSASRDMLEELGYL